MSPVGGIRVNRASLTGGRLFAGIALHRLAQAHERRGDAEESCFQWVG